MSTTSIKPLNIGLILGSPRATSNTVGIATYIQTLLTTPNSTLPPLAIHPVNLVSSPSHPLPYVLDEIIPQAHPIESLPLAYTDPSVQVWSSWVLSKDAIIILSPQYNWSMPAILKNALDHLYHEWVHKPVCLMTLGGRGGGKSEAALRVALAGGLDANVIEDTVPFVLPPNYIRSMDRIGGGEEWLKDYDGKVLAAVGKLIEAVEKRKVEGDVAGKR